MTVDPPPRSARRPAILLALACAAFIVYGSLFPFDFQSTAKPFKTIFAEWNPTLDRSDAVDNILLFVPLGAALFFACRSTALWVVGATASWLALGVGLQVLQLYLPSRVASMADAVNNAFGLIIGLLIARGVAPWLRRKQLIGRLGDPLALFLVGAWYVYESFPFLPTLDVGLLATHIKPLLAAPAFEPVRLLRHALAAALGTLALLAARPLWSRPACLTAAAAALFASELLVAYGDLRLEALLGIAVGMAIGERLDHLLGMQTRRAVLALAITALTFTVVTAFRGPPDSSRFTLTPFSHLLWRGTTVEVPTAAFEALAIGSLLWAGVSGGTPLGARPWQWPAVVILLVAVLEGVRILLGTGLADTSTLVMAVVLSPFAAAMHRRRATTILRDRVGLPSRPRSPDYAVAGPVASLFPESTPTTAIPAVIRAATRRTVAWQALAALVIMTCGLRLLLEVPAIPYNVLELFETRSAFHLSLFAAALLWVGAGPWCVAQAVVGRPAAPLWLPALVVISALFSLLLLRLSVTQESLDDITGSTDLYRRVTMENYWGAAWGDRMAALPAAAVYAFERGVRYTALYSLVLVPMTMAALCADKRWPMRYALPALAVLTLCWWLAKWVVVDGAITDNLTELIADDGLPWLAALTIVFALHVAWASQRASLGRGIGLGVITLAALPLCWWLLKQGLEQVIIKYDAVWSAQQFLLGRNRSALLSEGELFMRWSAVYLAMLCVCALGMSLARRAWVAPARGGRAAAADANRQRHRHEH